MFSATLSAIAVVSAPLLRTTAPSHFFLNLSDETLPRRACCANCVPCVPKQQTASTDIWFGYGKCSQMCAIIFYAGTFNKLEFNHILLLHILAFIVYVLAWHNKY